VAEAELLAAVDAALALLRAAPHPSFPHRLRLEHLTSGDKHPLSAERRNVREATS